MIFSLPDIDDAACLRVISRARVERARCATAMPRIDVDDFHLIRRCRRRAPPLMLPPLMRRYFAMLTDCHQFACLFTLLCHCFDAFFFD